MGAREFEMMTFCNRTKTATRFPPRRSDCVDGGDDDNDNDSEGVACGEGDRLPWRCPTHSESRPLTVWYR